jgi:hypothetical protein
MGGFGLPAFDLTRWALFCRPACACADVVSALLAQRLDDLIPLISFGAILGCPISIPSFAGDCVSQPPADFLLPCGLFIFTEWIVRFGRSFDRCSRCTMTKSIQNQLKTFEVCDGKFNSDEASTERGIRDLFGQLRL